MRTVGEQSYRIKELKLRFFSCQNMYAPRDEVSPYHVRTCMVYACNKVLLRSIDPECHVMQDANAYLDHILSEAGARVSTDSAPDVPSDIRKGGKHKCTV